MTDEELRMLQEYAAKMGLMNMPQPAPQPPPPVVAPPPPPPPPMLAAPGIPAPDDRNKWTQKQIQGTDPDQYWETLRLLAEDAKRKELEAARVAADKAKATRTRGDK